MFFAVMIRGEVCLFEDRHRAEHEANCHDTIVEIVDVIEITQDE